MPAGRCGYRLQVSDGDLSLAADGFDLRGCRPPASNRDWISGPAAATFQWVTQGGPHMTGLWSALPFLPLVVAAQVPSDREAPRPTVSGVVYDSVMARPLAGARVQLTGVAGAVAGRSLSATSDQSGRFAFPSITPGSYVAGFFHEVLDSMGIESLPVSMVVGSEDRTIALTVPSSRTIISSVCGLAAVADSVGMLLGHVYSVGGGYLTGARVTVEWGETLIDGSDVRMRNVSSSVGTMGPGWFAICDVPAGIELTLSASHDADSSGYVNLTVPFGGVRQATFFVGGAWRVPASDIGPLGGDSAVAGGVERIWRGSARLSGTVLGEDGIGVPDARVLVRGTNLSATSNDRGHFFLDSLPGGTQTAEVRTLGFLPTTKVVHLDPARQSQVDFRIGDRAVTLDAVRVSANLVYSRNLARFRANRERNVGGVFVGPREIEQFRGMRFSNLVQGIPGVRVRYGGGFAILMEYTGTDDGHSQGLCVPQFYVDGQRSRYTAAEVEGLYGAGELAGVEVYVRGSQRPSEFQDIDSHCGAIVVWTRPQLRRPRTLPPG